MNTKTLNELKTAAHENAVKHGFWDEPMSDWTALMLVITEISEAVEADRKGRHADLEAFERATDTEVPIDEWNAAFQKYMKDTVEDELADAAIRLLDFSGYKGYALEYLDVSKVMQVSGRDFAETAFTLVMIIVDCASSFMRGSICWALIFTDTWCKSMHINLESYIRLKMGYNASRPYKHGKKY